MEAEKDSATDMREAGQALLDGGEGGSAPSRHFVVGIGASAGGLEALSAVVSHLPVDLGASYVVVQHMSPNHRSMMVQLLARETAMPVLEIVNGDVPLTDHVYITPPNRNLTLQDGRFVLTEPAAEILPKPSVNLFFTSLAEDRGENAIAVVLSGTGSDGAVGVGAIKASGGLVFAQDPESAKYSGMPQAAIDTDCVDRVLTPEQTAAEIENAVRSQGAIYSAASGEHVPATLRTLLKRVMRHARVDFSGYKETTVLRRILRRMVTNRVHTMEDYLLLTERNPDELNQLCKEILISVTSFFRDPKAFAALRAPLADLLAQKRAGDEIRIWIAGCATGEEAYSVAILLSELLGKSTSDFRIQIFATDIDLNAMAVARRGVYPDSALSELDPAWVERYFVRREASYEVSKAVRDMVVFARQDLAQDPPFLRLDLITCRNVLIYFQSVLQEQVLSTFHYALRPGGLLFLGKSETAHQRDGQFESIARDAKIFRRRVGDSKLPSQILASGGCAPADVPTITTRQRGPGHEERLVRAVLDVSLPPSVLITAQFEVRHVFGEIAEFLNIRSGRPDFNLLSLIRPEWRIEAQTIVYQAIQRRQPVVGRLCGDDAAARLTVRPVAGKLTGGDDLFLVSFEAQEVLAEGAPRLFEGEVSQSIEDELIATREHLQTVIEELETSNEETQALNEELQASNEELQASNEELQASNEELQSTNEELTTVNEELQIKTAELAEANADLENIQNSIGFVIMVVNDQMRLVRFNLTAQQWLSLGHASIGESLRAIPNVGCYPDLIPVLETVLKEQRPIKRQVAYDGRHFLLSIVPRMISARESMGAVITLSEESDLVEAQRRLRESELRLRAVMSHSVTAVAVKDLAGRYEYVNPRYCELFGVDSEALIGKTDQQVFPAELAKLLRNRDIDALRVDGVLETCDALPIADTPQVLHGARFPLKGDDGVNYALCVKLSTDASHADR